MHADPAPARASFNPLDYSLAELQKAIIALIGFLGLAAFFLIKTDFSPALVPAVQALVPPAFAVVAVFLATNHTPADLQKALIGFATASYGVFEVLSNHKVDPGTVETIAVLIGYLATFVGVIWAKGAQKPPIDDQRHPS